MFLYHHRQLHCGAVPLDRIANAVGTPCYVYSAESIRDAYLNYEFALNRLPHRICYAVKANSTLAVLKLLADAGAAFDIVSGGELYRVLQAGGDPARVVFSGVGKTAAEIEYALATGIHSFNCESEDELALLDSVARKLGVVARFSLRVNPDVDAGSHPYISTGLTEHKFGIEIRRAPDLYRKSLQYLWLRADGISCHIGSQMLDVAPLLEAVSRIVSLAEQLQASGHALRHLDIGGGIGIAYAPDQTPPDIHAFFQTLHPLLLASGLEIFVEPGRSIVGQAGVLLTQVLARKRNGSKEFVIVDAAMNDLIRPALYQSHHEILPLDQSEELSVVDVVGPVCESGDFLARDRALAGARPGDYLAIASAGAYGFAQSSNYNSRPRAAEVLVENGTWRVIRERETYGDLVRGETL